MEDTLISFETAKLAKEKSFDLPTWYYFNVDNKIDETIPEGFSGLKNEIWQSNTVNKYSNNKTAYNYYQCSAPTQALLQKWLRDIHNIHVVLLPNDEGLYGFAITIANRNHTDSNRFELDEITGNYEEALEKGLQEALKLIK
jgi:hypothetical protein